MASNMSAFSTRSLTPLSPPDKSSTKIIALDDLENGLTKTAALYWRMLRGDRNLPPRSWLAPRDMRAILRNVVLLKVLDAGKDYEYRIVGDMFAWAYDAQNRNKHHNQNKKAAPEHGKRMRGMYEHVRVNAEPLAVQGWVGRDYPATKFVYYETVVLPLGEDGTTGDHLLVTSCYVPKAD